MSAEVGRAAAPGPRGAGGARVATRLLAALVLGLLFWSIFLSGGGGAGRVRSVASVQPNGRLAAYLLLEELGLRPEAWRRAPGELPRGRHVLVLPDQPPVPLGLDGEGTPPLSARAEPSGGPGAAGPPDPRGSLRDPRHYARFLREGGTLLLALADVDEAFLTETLGLEAFALHPLELEAGETAAELLGAAWDAGGHLAGLPEPPLESPFEVLGVDVAGRPVAVELAAGRGRLVLLPSLAFLDNARIGEREHGLLLVRLVEQYLRGERRLLFDEYALGGWRPDTPLEVAFSPSLAALSWHVMALALLALWRSAWVREFVRDPVPVATLSPVTRARALSGLLLSARRTALLGRMLRAGVLRRLAARAGLRGEEAAFHAGEEPDPERVRRLLERLPARGASERDREGWLRALTRRDVAGADELEALAAELGRIERAAAQV